MASTLTNFDVASVSDWYITSCTTRLNLALSHIALFSQKSNFFFVLMFNPLILLSVSCSLIMSTQAIPNGEVNSKAAYPKEVSDAVSRLKGAELNPNWVNIMTDLLRGNKSAILPISTESDRVNQWADVKTCGLRGNVSIVFTDTFRPLDVAGRYNYAVGAMMDRLLNENVINATFFANRDKNEGLRKQMYQSCYDVYDRVEPPKKTGFNRICCVDQDELAEKVCLSMSPAQECCARCQTTELALDQKNLFLPTDETESESREQVVN